MIKKLSNSNLKKLVEEALAIEARDAKETGALGYMARALVQATMPHKSPGDVKAWGRRNGNFSMVMQPGYIIDASNEIKSIGLPYGTKPRLIMAFISSEAIKTKSREIVLGRSLSQFMEQLDLQSTGGRWGTIPMLKEQMKRLFSATISFHYQNQVAEVSRGFKVASQTILFWDQKCPNQTTLWESTVTLTDEFYKEIIQHPVPINMNALSALKSSSLALDIYLWLTYRMSYLKYEVEIPWELLALQFGSDYSELKDFKKNFLWQLRKVLTIYDVRVTKSEGGLLLKPSKTHIRKTK